MVTLLEGSHKVFGSRTEISVFNRGQHDLAGRCVTFEFDVSDDGETVIAGDDSCSCGQGAVIIYEYSRSMKWHTPGFIGGKYNEGLGTSLSLSGNGRLLAASSKNATKVYEKRDTDEWLQIGQTLPGNLNFISGDGSALVTSYGFSPSDVQLYRLKRL